jgi:hypothetical protein
MGEYMIYAFFVVYGCLYLLFAFVEPPPALRSWFKIPGIFIFFPERVQLRWGRITLGLLFMSFPFLCALRTIFVTL